MKAAAALALQAAVRQDVRWRKGAVLLLQRAARAGTQAIGRVGGRIRVAGTKQDGLDHSSSDGEQTCMDPSVNGVYGRRSCKRQGHNRSQVHVVNWQAVQNI